MHQYGSCPCFYLWGIRPRYYYGPVQRCIPPYLAANSLAASDTKDELGSQSCFIR